MKTKLLWLILFAVCLFVAVEVQAESGVLEDDYQAIALWHCDEALPTVTNGVTPDDDSLFARSNHLIGGRSGFSVPTLVPGKYGNALSFDGDGLAWASMWKDTYSEVEIDMWANINMSSIPDDNQHLAISTGSFELYYKGTTGKITFTIRGVNNAYAGHAEVDVSQYDGQWIHIYAKYTSDLTATLDVNGTVDTITATQSMWQRNNTVWIGGRPENTGMSLDGMLDEIKISVPNLVTPEIYSPYPDGYKTYGLWHMDELIDIDGSDVVVDDDSDALVARDNNVVAMHAFNIYPVVSDANLPYDGFGGSIFFDGYEGLKLELPDALDEVPGDNFRIEGWAKLSEDAVDYYDGGTEYAAFNIFKGGDHAMRLFVDYTTAGWRVKAYSRFRLFDENGVYQAYAGSTAYGNISTDVLVNWNHFATEFVDGRMKLYLNGEPFGIDGALISDGYIRYPNASPSIGDGFWGSIDEVRITALDTTAPCGWYGYAPGDVNKDCVVDIEDIIEMASIWLGCTDPQGDCSLPRFPL